MAYSSLLAGLWVGRRVSGTTQPTFQRLTFQRGTVVAARFGPDGQTVYYSAAWEGGRAPYLLAAAGLLSLLWSRSPPANLLAISSAGEMAVQLEPKSSVSGFAMTGTLARAPLSGRRTERSSGPT